MSGTLYESVNPDGSRTLREAIARERERWNDPELVVEEGDYETWLLEALREHLRTHPEAIEELGWAGRGRGWVPPVGEGSE